MDIFISYRRDGGFEFSARLHDRLRSMRYLSFFDIESMSSGQFNKQLYTQIENCPNFLLVLSPNALDRCKNKGDWVREEIAHALKHKKNIILVLLPGFEFPDDLPDDIKDVCTYQGVSYSNWNFTPLVEKVISYLKNADGQPLKQIKEKRDNNVYYNTAGISEKEYRRIDDEMKVSSIIEAPYLNKVLEGKENLIGFAPSLYSAKTCSEYFSHPAFSKVYMTLCNPDQLSIAKQYFTDENKYFFYDPIDTAENLDNLMSKIERDNHLEGFDFVYLNIFLMDSDEPIKKLKVIRNHLNDGGIIFVRDIDDTYVCAYPDPTGVFDKAISIINDDKYAGNRQIGREIFTLLKMVGAKEVHRCPSLLTTVEMSHRNKERTFNAWFGFQESEFETLVNEEPDNLLYRSDLEWYTSHLPEMERAFLREDFFFSCGFVYYYGVFEKEE